MMENIFITGKTLLVTVLLAFVVTGCERTRPVPIPPGFDPQTDKAMYGIDLQAIEIPQELDSARAEESVPVDESGLPPERIPEPIFLPNVIHLFDPITEVEMVFVEGGTMEMQGREISLDSFYIGRFVLNRYVYIRAHNWAHGRGYLGHRRPMPHNEADVISALISWVEAIVVSNWLSMMEGLEPVYWRENRSGPVLSSNDIIGVTGGMDYGPFPVFLPFYIDWNANGYRLPTDAEWEFAARGGNESMGFRYAGSDTLAQVLFEFRNSLWQLNFIPGQMMPNELGLHDMSGPASEWVIGPWIEYGGLEPARNPGRVSRFDFVQPFYLLQKGGNAYIEFLGVNNQADFVAGSSFRLEERIRFAPDRGEIYFNRELMHASIRLVRNADPRVPLLEKSNNHE